MNIAFVIYNYSESKGGVERYAFDLTRHLAQEGHQIHIFCHHLDSALAGPPDQPSVRAGNQINNVTFHLVPASGFFPALKYLSFADNVAETLKEEKFDIIQGFGRTYYQDVYRVGSGCHWEYLKQRHPSMKHILGRLIQYLNPRNQIIIHLEKKSFTTGINKKIICISKKVKEEIQQYYQIPDEAVRIIYNGIDLERFSMGNRTKYRAPTRKELGFADNDVVLLFVGSGFERKGLPNAIAGMANVTEDKRRVLRLLVIGKGNQDKYRALAKKYGIAKQILFIGVQDRIERYYAASDIFLFPTLFEPFGTVCLEAMASGLPVITTSAAGASEIMTDGIDSFILRNAECGIRNSEFPACCGAGRRNPRLLRRGQAISEIIARLLDGALRANMGQAAALTAAQYSFEKNLAQMKEVYGEILRAKS